jgi:hypothetical protein
MLGIFCNLCFGQSTTSSDATKQSVRGFNAVESMPELAELFSIVIDKTVEVKSREMPAYRKLCSFFKDKSFAEIKNNFVFRSDVQSLYLHPADHRGDLVLQQQIVRRIDKNGDSNLFEVWCSSDNSPFWLQVLITDRLPRPYTDGNERGLVGKPIELLGFFFKLHSFYPAKSKPNEKPSVAPLFIGLLNPVKIESSSALRSNPVSISFRPMALALVGCFFLLSMALFMSRLLGKRNRHSSTVSNSSPPDLSWISQTESDPQKSQDSESNP